ncbi:hypothetical protein BDB00DRAFT_873512 [Zychaea mexicana]|uniref:uncharacterized protein n=1 Tax=Zychaea mexicana TaxID=64656 RepID=UPI0022FE0D3A|nr:uncharacterized protein BDB00DRAFT_873512 [Zychaea mexicana]KAI9492244.1 hypothetical protein BDB00DRAFT_873512 [Zychaea mexicana]
MGNGAAAGDGHGGADGGHGGADGAFEGGRRTSLSSASEADFSERQTHPPRPPLNRNDTTDDPTLSRNSTDDEGYIPAQVPLEILAGKFLYCHGNALVTNYTDHDQFDWAGGEDDDEEEKNEKNKTKTHKPPGVVLCLSRNSSYIAWSLLILFALILIAIDVAVFVAYENDASMVSYNLQLWFTWAAFMWCVSILIQLVVELVPWAIKRLVGFLRPQSTEVLRMRLAYYMALRPFLKALIVSAWNWGSWAFIRNQLALPADQNRPDYVDDFYSVWQCVFFAALMLFIEKFVLQLIVTSFHKKAYGERIGENDHALKILDRLKKTKRKAPQDFIFKRMRRSKERPAKTSRSNSTDESPPHSKKANENGNGGQTQSIMRAEDGTGRGNVHFPTNNMDTLIAIPALESRSDDEKILEIDEKSYSPEIPQEQHQQQQQQQRNEDTDRRGSSDFVTSLTRRLREAKANKKQQKQQQQSVTSPPQVDSPPPLTRTSTWMSFPSDDRSFLKATNNTASIPGRLLKGGFKKLRSQSNNIVAPQGTSRQAKVLAKRIFHNIVGTSGRHSISEKDLYPFFRTHQEAASAFQLFDRDGNGSIDKGELRSACVRIYRERKNLATSMRDLSQATGKLDIILLVIFVAIWVIIVCASFGVDVGTQLMPLWSAFIAASFVFGNSAKDAFESIIFVFVTHPFDAGDRVFIGEENWVVDQVGLLVSTFIKWDGSVVYAKNSVLSTQYIINVRRTGITGETVDIHIAFTTPSWKIHRLRDHMMEWTNQFPHLYNVNGTTANIISFENQNRITVTMYFEHNKNWQDLGDRWLRHNNFMMELKDECDRLDIYYVLPSQPFESSKKECPPETNNMGKKKSYGQEGMRVRQGFPGGGDDDDSQFRGDSGGPGGPGGPGGNDNSGAEAGAAAALVFTTGAM